MRTKRSYLFTYCVILSMGSLYVEQYSSLREFFAGVVKMENEKIVFKKIH